MRDTSCMLSRRRLILMAGIAARLKATEPDFWNNKPASEWSTGDIYQLANHSPWANPVQSWANIYPPWLPGGPRVGGRGTANEWPAMTELGPKGVITWESAEPLR